MPELPELPPGAVVEQVTAVHARERACTAGLTERQVRAAATLPGWSRGHVLAARLVFLRAAVRQVDHVLSGRRIDFYDGGKSGREAQIEAHAHRPGAELVRDVGRTSTALDACWAGVGAADWARRVSYREGGPLTLLALASWREAELHLVDLDLGKVPSSWSRDFCLHLFGFLTPRVPDGTRLDLVTPQGDVWGLGEGEPVRVTGTMTDLAAWLAGRSPEGPVVSDTGPLPALRRLRDARRAGQGAQEVDRSS
ncbi:maleylpyruvate isomerase family mycothiol-dependent enzyme [Streptomyces prunicolor]|jgi:maleylpyruvate isomerase|uniref:maleylpyruvate isomerase family mycothiol-dependent enzyme n=1 Tax=Streptomyces prunicolor TaxID=67348 RepID=UPI003448DFB6